MAEEEEIRLEVEAAMAVYGDDCRVVREFPPHLALHVRPRTADDSSQQFVEAILAIKSSTEYPNEPPHVYAIETKGLDENRKTYLITSVQQKAQELSSCPMLVALCEEAVEILSSMNHPDGDCPLCLDPLVVEMAPSAKWHQSSRRDYCYCRKPESSDMHEVVNQHKGNCPVCRKVFDEKDLEHVLGDLETDSFQLGSAVSDIDEEETALLQSESENHRRQQFEVLIKLQRESDGLIEPKKDLLILPGMFLPATSVPPSTSTEVGSSKQSEDNSCSSTVETGSNSSPNKATTNNRTSLSSRRKHKGHRSRKQQHAHFVKRQQWIRKEEDGSEQ